MRLTRVTLFCIVLILGFGFYRLGAYLLEDTEAQTLQATEEAAVDTANILASLVETQGVESLRDVFASSGQRQFQAQIFKHQKTRVGLSVYITDAQGFVLFDSLHPEHVGRDYSDKRDVSRTLRGEYGARSSREDETDPLSSVMYIGAPVWKSGAIVGCLSVYKPQADVRAFIDDRRSDIISATVLIGAGILFLIGAVFIWVFRPIGKLTQYARGIAKGERRARPNIGRGREVNTLADALTEMRQALEGRQYATRYVQALTHELKSPLAAIQGAAELIDDEMPDADRERFLANIRDQTKRCTDLIHRLLELSSVEAQTHLSSTSALDMAKLCQLAVEESRPLAETRSVQLSCELPESCAFTGNEGLLRTAISQMLENAIQFSPSEGTVTLSLEMTAQSIELTICDEGPGIPDFVAKRAFERFYSYREEPASRGNGLGLAFVKEVAELHHGSALISSLPKRGTLVTIMLPRE